MILPVFNYSLRVTVGILVSAVSVFNSRIRCLVLTIALLQRWRRTAERRPLSDTELEVIEGLVFIYNDVKYSWMKDIELKMVREDGKSATIKNQ